jgi:protein-S-isoprenylcysteine O-methyltransferase
MENDLSYLISYAVILFPASELTLMAFKRSNKTATSGGDKGSMWLLWLAIIVSIGVSVALQWYPAAKLPVSRFVINASALLFLAAGMALRWTAILSLGKMFTVDVAIQQGHRLMRSGIYKYVRHPSYAGLLLEFFGLSLYFGTWIVVVIIMVPVTAALVYRIRCEEAVLTAEFGDDYRAYQTTTKALVPGVF